MSPRLRSNWRRPAPQAAEGTERTTEEDFLQPTEQSLPTTLPADAADAAPEPVNQEEQPRPRSRRPTRSSRTSAVVAATNAGAEEGGTSGDQAEAAGNVSSESAQRRPARRRVSRPASVNQATEAAVLVEDAQETIEPAPSIEAPVSTEEVAVASTASDEIGTANVGSFLPSRSGQRFPARNRQASPLDEGVEPAPAPSASFAGPDFEPLPPPTKRKAPRNGFGPPRPAQTPSENAVDWALGRGGAMAEDEQTVETTANGGSRRRSRRGRRGRGGGGEPAITEGRPQEPGARAADLREERPPAQPAAREAPAFAPAREDRSRSQLSTFESLVARQNVVLDALLAKVASFSSIERALMAIERRLSSQGYGASGAAAPRVGIFVDVPNIIYAADRIGVTIDFAKLLHHLTRGRELVRASAYAPISDDPQQRLDTQKFVQPFVHRGYRIVTKPLKRFSDGTMKGNFDVELAMDVLTMSDRLDVVSLISGDGDFSRLVEIVGSKGVRVEVVAFGASTSSELRAICDDYIDLAELLGDLT